MKNILLIFSMLLFNNLYSQKVDTLDYLKKIEYNKAKYIGKPFSVLLKDLKELEPKTIWALAGGHNIKIVRRSHLVFSEDPFSTDILSIEWDSEILRERVNFYEMKNDFRFTQEEKEFYSNKIIKNIEVDLY